MFALKKNSFTLNSSIRNFSFRSLVSISSIIPFSHAGEEIKIKNSSWSFFSDFCCTGRSVSSLAINFKTCDCSSCRNFSGGCFSSLSCIFPLSIKFEKCKKPRKAYYYSTSALPIKFPASLSASSSSSPSSVCNRPAFLDYQSTTPMDPRVTDAMLPFFCDMFGNPHSRSHTFGWEAEVHVEKARENIAKLINGQPKNIIFTSGATEANNLAVKGVCGFYGRINDHNNLKNHIITTQIEHKCVLSSCRSLQEKGFEVTYLPVNQDGILDIEELENNIRPSTIMCSVIHVNNEIGVIQNIEKIGKICRKHKIIFHTDAAQSVGKVDVDVEKMNIDLMSISGHKMYGPKGIGALYVRNKPRVRLVPLIDGGGQERGIRSGTLPVGIVVGFGEACRIAKYEMQNDKIHIEKLANKLQKEIFNKIPEVKLNGSKTERYIGNANLSFAFVEGESLLMSLKNVAVSSGSACTSASLEPSYVLRAIGVSEDLAHTSIRFGIGRFTTEEEINKCIEDLITHVNRLREMSPLFEIALDKANKEKQGNVENDENATKFVWT